MGEALLTTLSMENYHPSTLLLMDSGSLAHDELERKMNRYDEMAGKYTVEFIAGVESFTSISIEESIDDANGIKELARTDVKTVGSYIMSRRYNKPSSFLDWYK
ncbi:unnamed protein product [Dovyalis caffra]|uniref:Uncharacterized protein n=1 Tax=Dovyalis caffra TaxID=77055 RepID=A0AAV1SA71_9ROSI|nr:unnamed protein product [Dovyalis caffra]